MIHLQIDKQGEWYVTTLVHRSDPPILCEVGGDFNHVLTEKDNWHYYGACKDKHDGQS